MSVIVALAGAALILLTLLDAFESMLLPRRVTGIFRFAQFFYRCTWSPWAAAARQMRHGKRRDMFLSVYGPLSILVLFLLWATELIVGFAMLSWSIGGPLIAADGPVQASDHLYMSGVTFFTLGYGDVTPSRGLGRLLSVTEAGVGFGFLAVVISYLPVLYQAFSRREVTIAMMDARAGSPPSAARLFLRLGPRRDPSRLDKYLVDWERWSAELLESHLSFPVLSYYRSQHDNQSWLAMLTAALDVSALVVAGVKRGDPYQAQLTFAMARHAAVDLAQLFQTPPLEPIPGRLDDEQLSSLCEQLRASGLEVREGMCSDGKLAELRGMYEPFVNALAQHFLFTIPEFLPESEPPDNWQTSAWMRRTSGIGRLVPYDPADDHAY